MFELTEIIEKIKQLSLLDYLTFFVFAFFIMRFLVSFVNFIYNPLKSYVKGAYNYKISVLIPARNEEKNLPKILDDLLNQTYQNFEIIVYDDNSIDETRNIIKKYNTIDSRIKYKIGEELPEKWLGKNYACYNLATEATGDYYVFIDADVRLETQMLEKSVWFAVSKKLALFSVYPQQITLTKGEILTVPLMNFILLTLLALPSLAFRWFFKSLSAANGQFMFFEAQTYRKFQPHKLMKLQKAEDISIARFYKKKRQRIRCLANLSDIKCRMYESYKEATDGFSKNIVNILGGNYVFASIFLIVSAFGLIFLFFNNIVLFLISLFANILSHFFVSRISKRSFFYDIFLSFVRIPVLANILIISIIKRIKKDNKWKGRNIYS